MVSGFLLDFSLETNVRLLYKSMVSGTGVDGKKG
jgi:hypothetical protein